MVSQVKIEPSSRHTAGDDERLPFRHFCDSSEDDGRHDIRRSVLQPILDGLGFCKYDNDEH